MTHALSLPAAVAASSIAAAAAAAAGDEVDNKKQCQFYLIKKRRYCSSSPLHTSHSVLRENLDAHVKRCPLKKQVETLEAKPYYSKGINAGVGALEGSSVGSEAKRKAIYGMSVGEFNELVGKIRALHSEMNVELKESFVEPDACKKWINQQVDRQVPYQQKHVMQQVSIIGNMEEYRILKKTNCKEGMQCDARLQDEKENPVVVEFGAGRGYLTHMLADCYEMKKIILVERRSYKLKGIQEHQTNGMFIYGS